MPYLLLENELPDEECAEQEQEKRDHRFFPRVIVQSQIDATMRISTPIVIVTPSTLKTCLPVQSGIGMPPLLDEVGMFVSFPG